MPHLTRTEMEAAIRDGGSVLYNGQTLWQLGQLPSVAELAKGDPEAETAAANAMQAQIADLQAQLATLIGATGAGASASDTPSLVEAIGQDAVDKLVAAGYAMPADVRAASDEQLLAIPGIGAATLAKIRAAVQG